MAMTAEILTSSPLIDADAIERDIGTVINSRRAPVIRPAPQLPVDELLPQGPMPDYVVHRDGVNRVGKLSAEAVVREYDAAVKEIEALGAELTEAAKKCEATVAGVHVRRQMI